MVSELAPPLPFRCVMGSMDPSEAAEGIAGALAEALAEALSYVLVPKTELEAGGRGGS